MKKANGDHSVYFDKSKGMYKGQIAIGYYDSGRIKRKSVFGATKTEVKQKLKKIELAIKSDDYIDESTVTIYQLAKQMQDDKLNYNEIKEGTYYRNIETLKRLQPIYTTPLQKATETQIKNFLLSQVHYSQSAINKMYGILVATFNEAQKRKIVNNNVMAEIRKPKSKKVSEEVRAFTVEEQNKLLSVLMKEDIKYSTQMLLSMLTGMRMGEINALKVKDVNFGFNVITVSRTISKDGKGAAFLSDTTKTYAGKRKIPMTDDVKKLLADYVRFVDGEMLFLSDRNRLVTTNQVNMELSRVLKKYNIVDHTVSGKVSCHSLRHTYATRCIEAGMQPKVLQTLLGHTDIRITLNTYCNAFENFQSDNIEKVNEYLKSLGLTVSA